MPRVTAPADDLPSHIGRYQVLKRLGEGATSDVFLASDPFNDHKEVAIKRMRSWAPVPDAPSSDFSNRFFSAEAALAGQLHHPNVVAILDAVAEEAAPYLVMEYVPGVTLKHYCRSDRLLPLDQIVEVTFKCAMALGYVYRQGLIHRDVKPANLLAVVDASGQVVDVKVSDFGSALNLNADATQIHRVGSLAYMPPEQIDGGDVDCRADIYALGAVLYHLIGGRPPFDAPHQMALMHQIYHQPPLPLVGQRQGVSEALDAVVQKALAKGPHDRFPDWESFAQALSGLVASQQVPLNRLGEVRDSERFNMLRSLEFFAEFGDVQDRHRVGEQCQPPRPDRDAGGEIADDRAQSQRPRQRHGEHRGAEKNQARQQPAARVVHAQSPGGGLRRSFLGSSSTFTSLNVAIRTEGTNRLARYMSQTQASTSSSSMNARPPISRTCWFTVLAR